MTRRSLVVWGFFLTLHFFVVQATQVTDLYNAQIPVASQEGDERASAIKQGFLAVLVKVSGNSQTAQQANLITAAANAENYVQQYSYDQNSLSDATIHPYLLTIKFIPTAVNSLLLQNNIAVWGRDRPLTLFWIVSNQYGPPNLVGTNDSGPIANLIDTGADQRGIPAILPVLDLTDLNSVSVNDVLTASISVIQQASARYGSNAEVILQLTQNANQWQSKWTLLINNNLQNWVINAAQLSDVINQGINQVADALATQFAVAPNMQQSTVQVQITGLQTLDSYVKARNYLTHLALVTSASIEQVAPGQAIFQLQLVGDVRDLQKQIALDHVLQPVDTTVSINNMPNAQMPTLEYQWSP